MSNMNEYVNEPIKGLPAHLPPGERILWQGKPAWGAFARDALHLRGLSIYFTALIAICLYIRLTNGIRIGDAVVILAPLILLGSAVILFLALFAYMTQRTTIYTITDRRLVVRYGIAMPKSVNLPFQAIGSVDLRERTDGTGNLRLTLNRKEHVAYHLLWPHVEFRHITRVRPMLRSVPEIVAVAALLSQALLARASTSSIIASPVEPTMVSEPRPIGPTAVAA